jgi:hypothetical protein
LLEKIKNILAKNKIILNLKTSDGCIAVIPIFNHLVDPFNVNPNPGIKTINCKIELNKKR